MQAAGEPDEVISAHLDSSCRMVGWIEPDGQHVRVVNGPFAPGARPERGQLLRLARRLTAPEEQRT